MNRGKKLSQKKQYRFLLHILKLETLEKLHLTSFFTYISVKSHVSFPFEIIDISEFASAKVINNVS